MDHRYTVLGPLEVHAGGAPLRLGSPQQQATLAILLLRDDGRPVSLDTMIGALWAEKAPPSAITTMRTYVHRLRRIGIPIDAAGRGYRVVAPPEAIDVHRAEAHLAGGGTRTLSAALDLWTGTPLMGLPGPFAEEFRSRAEDLRRGIEERLYTAEIGRGRASAVVAPLTRMLAANPYDERSRELLMLALHRTGRRAEALATYQEGRELLASDLGVDPGSRLQELFLRLLRDEAELPRDRTDAARLWRLLRNGALPRFQTCPARRSPGPAVWN